MVGILALVPDPVAVDVLLVGICDIRTVVVGVGYDVPVPGDVQFGGTHGGFPLGVGDPHHHVTAHLLVVAVDDDIGGGGFIEGTVAVEVPLVLLHLTTG